MSKTSIHVLARAVLIREGHLLVCHTQDLIRNFYFLPGGHVEYEERAEDCVLRELEEEGGITGSIKRFLGCLEFSFEPGQNSKCHNHEYNLYFEVACALDPRQEIAQREQHIKLVWVPLWRLKTLDFRPAPLIDVLERWLKQDLKAAFSSSMYQSKRLD